MAKHPTLAARNAGQKAPPPAPGEDPTEVMKRTLLGTLNADLRSHGRPTLADRVRVEGYAAQIGKGPKKGSVPKVKPKGKKR